VGRRVAVGGGGRGGGGHGCALHEDYVACFPFLWDEECWVRGAGGVGVG
jgi:hypothetical protein